jgi:TP901 family phage tail tape measure protein
MSSKYILEVQADPSGLSALGAEFKKLDATIQATARTASNALAGMGKTGVADLATLRSELEQVKGQLRTLGAENQKLTEQMAAGATRRVAGAKAEMVQVKATADAHVAAFKTQVAQAEQAEGVMKKLRIDRGFQNAKQRLDDAAGESKLTQMKIAEAVKAADAQLKVQAKLEAEMRGLKQARVFSNHAAEAAALRALTAEAVRYGSAASHVFDVTNGKLVPAQAAHIRNTKALSYAYNESHAAARGLSGGLGALWMTYGSLIPLMAGFAAASALKTGIKDAAEFNRQMVFVGAITRDATESMADAVGRMGEIGSKVLTVMKDSLYAPLEGAEAMRVLAQAGLSAREALATLPAVLDLATVGEMKVADAAFSLVTMLRAFNLEMGQSQNVTDMLAKAATISVTSVSGISESMKQATVVGEQYNISLQDTLVGLVHLSETGLKGTAAGTAFRNMVSNLYTPTQHAAKALKELGVNAFDAEGKMKPLRPLLGELRTALEKYGAESQKGYLTDIFTERGLKGASNALNRLDKYGETLREIADSAGYTKPVVEELKKTLSGQWDLAINAAKVSLMEMGQQSEGPLLDAVVKLKEAFGSEEFKNFAGAIISGFASVAAWIASNGSLVGDFIMAVVGYKAGRFLWSGAVAGVQALSAAIPGLGAAVAGTAASVGLGAAAIAARGGLLGVALFGGWAVGDFLGRFEIIRDSVGWVMTPLFAAIKALDDANDRVKGKASSKDPANYWEGAGAQQDADAATAAANAIREAAATAAFRRSENLYTPPAKPRPMATGSLTRPDDDAIKAAQDAVLIETNKYKQLESVAKAHYDTQLAILRAYHSAGIISDEQFAERMSQLQSIQSVEEIAALQKHIDNLLVERRKLGTEATKQAKIDLEIARAREDLHKRSAKAEQQAVEAATKAWKQYNTEGENVLKSAQKANDTLREEIEVIKTGTAAKKDQTSLSLAVRIATEEETLARLENVQVVLAQTDTDEIKARVTYAEIEAIQARLPLLRQELAERKGLLAERKELESDVWLGAQRGLNQYIDNSLSSAKIMEHAFKKAFGGIEDALVSFVMTGKANISEMLTSVGEDIVRMLIKLQITQPIARYLSGIMGGGGGGSFFNGDMLSSLVSGGSSAAGGGGTWSMLSNVGSLASDAWGGAGAMTGAIGTGLATAGTAMFGASSAMTGVGLGMSAAGSMGMGTAFMTGASALATGATSASMAIGMMIPVIGWIIAAAAALYAIFGSEGGGPKLEGSFAQSFSTYGGRSGYMVSGEHGSRMLRGDGLDAALAKPGNAAVEGYLSAVRRLGGVSPDMVGFGLGVSHDNQGSAMSRLLTNVTVNGRSVLDTARDMDDKDIDKQMPGEITRMMVAALRETDFHDAIDELFDNIDPVTASVEELNAVLQAAAEMKTVLDGLDDLNFNGLDLETLRLMAKEGETIGQTWDRVGGQIVAFNAAFTTEAQKLRIAQNSVTTAFAEMGIAIPESSQAFYDLVHGLDLSTEAGRDTFDALMAVAPAFTAVSQAVAQTMAEFDSLMSQIRPGYAAGRNALSLDAAASEFAAGNAWAAGMSTQQLVEALRTITREDFNNYLTSNPQMAQLILTILGLDHTMQGSNSLAAAALGPSGSAEVGTDLFNANLRPGPTYSWNGSQWINEAPGAETDNSEYVNRYRDSFNSTYDELFTSGSNRGEQLGRRGNVMSEQFWDTADRIWNSTSGPGYVGPNSEEGLALQDYMAVLLAEIQEIPALQQLYSGLLGETGGNVELADSLFDLEVWYLDQRELMSSNNEALLALEEVFGDRRTEILAESLEQQQEVMRRNQEQIANWLSATMLSPDSPLNPADRLELARNQYYENLTSARGGDADAIANYTRYADVFLRELRSMYGSDFEYLEGFGNVTSDAGALAGLSETRAPNVIDMRDGFQSVVQSLIDTQARLGRLIEANQQGTVAICTGLVETQRVIVQAITEAPTLTYQ